MSHTSPYLIQELGSLPAMCLNTTQLDLASEINRPSILTNKHLRLMKTYLNVKLSPSPPHKKREKKLDYHKCISIPYFIFPANSHF